MKKALKKILKIVGITFGLLIGLIILGIILSLLRLYIYANTDIPSGVEVDYIKGVWVVDPLDTSIAYNDLDRMKSDGINTISIGVRPADQSFISVLRKPFITHFHIIQFIKKAHQKGMAVHLVPVSWNSISDSPGSGLEMKDFLTREAISWAKFAEKYNVEFFSPLNEVDVVLGNKEGSKWVQEILPNLREVYNGQIVLKLGNFIIDDKNEADYTVKIEPGQYLSKEHLYIKYSDVTGYDYLIIDIFPSDTFYSSEKFPETLKKIIQTARDEVNKKGAKGVMIGEFGYRTGKHVLTPSYYIKPGLIVTPEQQADLIDTYLGTTMSLVDGIIHYGWATMGGYGIKGDPAENVIKKWFIKY